mmetsp:Transcript_1562/g.6431  ORF Transcript_1562/g.6431 Transcript_1562/m.6431 type:complete len:223 (-) Transcript_1562:197-865(-)
MPRSPANRTSPSVPAKPPSETESSRPSCASPRSPLSRATATRTRPFFRYAPPIAWRYDRPWPASTPRPRRTRRPGVCTRRGGRNRRPSAARCCRVDRRTASGRRRHAPTTRAGRPGRRPSPRRGPGGGATLSLLRRGGGAGCSRTSTGSLWTGRVKTSDEAPIASSRPAPRGSRRRPPWRTRTTARASPAGASPGPYPRRTCARTGGTAARRSRRSRATVAW